MGDKIMSIQKLMKSLIKPLISSFFQSLRGYKKIRLFKSVSTKDIFSEIYQKSLWGKSDNPDQPYYSGAGSHDKAITSVYLENVSSFLQTFSTKPAVVDLGCGDFFVGSQLRSYCGQYIACDIVPELIEYNKIKYNDLDVDFKNLDLITETLPVGDIVFIRQVLQHLSNEQIQKLISKLSSYRYLILTEHLPKLKTFVPNLDKKPGSGIRLGYHSGIVLTLPPFHLKVVNEQVLCEVEEVDGVIKTMLYKLQ